MAEESLKDFLSTHEPADIMNPEYSNRKFTKDFFNALIHGDVDYISNTFNCYEPYYESGTYADDPLRHEKDVAILLCANATMAASIGGADTDICSMMNVYFIRMIEKISDIDKVIRFRMTIVKEYSDLIKKKHSQNYSYTVTRIIHYIYGNIYSSIRVSDIAEELGLSTSYISSIFKKEVGIGIKEFSHIEKIKEAQRLLLFSDDTVTDIAYKLGYNDISHFNKACKTYAGCSSRDLKDMAHLNFS